MNYLGIAFVTFFFIWYFFGKEKLIGCIGICVILVISVWAIGVFIESTKSPEEKLNLTLSQNMEIFAKTELVEFTKNRRKIAETILQMQEKSLALKKDAETMTNESAKNRMIDKVNIVDNNIRLIKNKAIEINNSIQELYSIKQTSSKDEFLYKVNFILNKSEILRNEASEIATDFEIISK